ncbi:MAG: winged helix-turn-helix transcriptional regulator [Nanoarchaeota archaeon]
MPKKSTLLDERDRKILVELDKNSRQADSEIAKKLGISKQVTNYRIQKIVEKKIISNFYTIINVGSLGLNSYYVFLQLEKIDKNQENELLEKINSLDYVGWLVSGTGRWDAVVLIYADSISTFDKLLSEIINLCGDHLHEYNFTTLITAEHISYKFLAEMRDIHSAKQTEKIKEVSLDEIDKKILSAIAQNARLSIMEISHLIKMPPHVVNYHLKRLIKLKIIEGFKPKIDINKLGYQWHLLLIQIRNVTEARKKEFVHFCKQYKKIYYVTNTVGLYNLMLDAHVSSVEEFKEVLLELKSRFSDVIRLYESMIIFEEYKISYFPKGLL